MDFEWIRSIGWAELYAGGDEQKYNSLKNRLSENGIRFRAKEYTAANRLSTLAMQGLSARATKAPSVNPAALQAKYLGGTEMDVYYIYVRRADAGRARKLVSG